MGVIECGAPDPPTVQTAMAQALAGLLSRPPLSEAQQKRLKEIQDMTKMLGRALD